MSQNRRFLNSLWLVSVVASSDLPQSRYFRVLFLIDSPVFTGKPAQSRREFHHHPKIGTAIAPHSSFAVFDGAMNAGACSVVETGEADNIVSDVSDTSNVCIFIHMIDVFRADGNAGMPLISLISLI